MPGWTKPIKLAQCSKHTKKLYADPETLKNNQTFDHSNASKILTVTYKGLFPSWRIVNHYLQQSTGNYLEINIAFRTYFPTIIYKTIINIYVYHHSQHKDNTPFPCPIFDSPVLRIASWPSSGPTLHSTAVHYHSHYLRQGLFVSHNVRPGMQS